MPPQLCPTGRSRLASSATLTGGGGQNYWTKGQRKDRRTKLYYAQVFTAGLRAVLVKLISRQRSHSELRGGSLEGLVGYGKVGTSWFDESDEEPQSKDSSDSVSRYLGNFQTSPETFGQLEQPQKQQQLDPQAASRDAAQ
jgi:hypothetical protein